MLQALCRTSGRSGCSEELVNLAIAIVAVVTVVTLGSVAHGQGRGEGKSHDVGLLPSSRPKTRTPAPTRELVRKGSGCITRNNRNSKSDPNGG